MKKEKKINYNIGLDIGTTNSAWAVIDDNFKLLTIYKKVLQEYKDNKPIYKKGKKNLWGVNLFEEANTAKGRRICRSGRRRIDRRKYRILLLQFLLEPMVKVKDELFFKRMKESFRQMEDKSKGLYFPYLFKESKNNKIYQKKYKSIYHLRKELIDNKEKADPRLVYLAIHHIIKYRGNFLYEGQEFDKVDIKQAKIYLKEIDAFIKTELEKDSGIEENLEDILNLIIDKKLSYSEKKKIAKEKFSNSILNIIIAVLGYKFNMGQVLNAENKKEFDKDPLQNGNKTISFSEDYDSHKEEYLTALGSNEKILLNLKSLYEWYILYNLIGDNDYLSDSMVAKYEKHHKDLKRFKKFIRKNYSEKYNFIFKNKDYEKYERYCNYSYPKPKNKDNKDNKQRFYDYIKNKIIQPIADNAEEIDKNDINRLKEFIKNNCPDKYDIVFENETKSDNNFDLFSEDKKSEQYEIDINLVKEIVEPFKDNIDDKVCEEAEYFINAVDNNLFLNTKSEAEYFLNEIENKTFLNKQRYKDNGTIPYQLHKAELEKIIDNQSVYYPELRENKYKIISLLTFRVPYYVGPLNDYIEENAKEDKNGDKWPKFGWVSRKHITEEYEYNKKKINITPWNFDQEINELETAENFIKRLTNKCTYLPFEDVLPKNSLLYSEYCVLNELNKIKINGKIIDKSVKNKFIREVFKDKDRNKIRVTKSDLEHFLETQSYPGWYCNKDNEITGLADDKGFAANMQSYKDFSRIFGNIEKIRPMVEELIKWITLFPGKDSKDAKTLLKKKIRNKYDTDKISDDHLEKILKLNYSGWGRLSERTLNGICIEDINGYKTTLIDIMRTTNRNFMEIINGELKEALEKEIKKTSDIIDNAGSISYDDIDEIPTSPKNKRGIWQTVQIVEEITEYMGCPPKNIYIEFARSEENEKKGKKTKSRYEKLEELYKNIKNSEDFKINLKELRQELKDKQNRLAEEKLFLYFIQCGKDMYTGKPLEINSLSLYDVDHIIPQSVIKDDSIENKCLVAKAENALKSDNMISEDTIKARKPYWEYLNKQKLIGKKKLNNLQNKWKDNLPRFISRQLVETRQITKHVTNILNSKYKETNIYSVRANMISELRKKYDLFKVRDLNDCHHVHDAFLCAFLGQFIIMRYPKLINELKYGFYNFHKSEREELKDLAEIDVKEKQNSSNKFGFVINAFMKDYKNWNAEEKIKYMNSALNYIDYFITKKLEEGTGAFYNENLVLKNNNNLRIKKNLPTEKYGGYNNENASYISAVKYSLKSKPNNYAFVKIPIQISYMIKSGKETLEEYIKKRINKENISDLQIIRKKIKLNQLIKYNNHKTKKSINSFLYITSDEAFNNAKQFFCDAVYMPLLYLISNYDKIKNKEIIKEKICEKANKFSKEKITDYDSAVEFMINEFVNYWVNKIKKEYQIYLYQEIADVVSGYIKSEEWKKLEIYPSESNKISKFKFISELLKITKAQAEYLAAFKTDVFKFRDRKARLEFKISDLENVIIYDQSVTGIHEKAYKL